MALLKAFEVLNAWCPPVVDEAGRGRRGRRGKGSARCPPRLLRYHVSEKIRDSLVQHDNV